MPTLETAPAEQRLQKQAQESYKIRLVDEQAQFAKKREAVIAELALIDKTLAGIADQLKKAHAQA